MTEEMKTPLIEFLESLGIYQGDKPDVCPHCGAKYPYCNWDDVRLTSPCTMVPPEPKTKEKE